MQTRTCCDFYGIFGGRGGGGVRGGGDGGGVGGGGGCRGLGLWGGGGGVKKGILAEVLHHFYDLNINKFII